MNPMAHRPARNTNTHRRPKEANMEERKKSIIHLLDLVEHRTIMNMIYEIVHWIVAHQSDLI